jgi:hexosaminidase
MPGHSLAALAAYPEFSCTGGPFKVATEWGVFEDVYCLGNDQTLTFLEEVMEEVLALFPSPFIHIGGDECPKKRWHECPRCQARMREEGLKDEDELQSWLIRRMDTFLRARGRRLIGWDEILEGGLASGAAVMSWRGETGGIAAAQAGHDVVMTPGDSVYFNFSQDQPETNPLLVLAQIPHTPLAHVHQYEPVPDALSPAEAKHILGAQGQLWTEFMPTPQRVEHMAFPRAHALAEVLWSPRTARDYESFLTRLPATFQLLNNAGIAHGPIPCELAVI